MLFGTVAVLACSADPLDSSSDFGNHRFMSTRLPSDNYFAVFKSQFVWRRVPSDNSISCSLSGVMATTMVNNAFREKGIEKVVCRYELHNIIDEDQYFRSICQFDKYLGACSGSSYGCTLHFWGPVCCIVQDCLQTLKPTLCPLIFINVPLRTSVRYPDMITM